MAKKLTVKDVKLYGRIERDEHGRFKRGEPLLPPVGFYENDTIWALIRGEGPQGRYLLTATVLIDNEPTKEATFRPINYEHPKTGPFQFTLPIPVPNVPLDYEVVVFVDGEELVRFPVEFDKPRMN